MNFRRLKIEFISFSEIGLSSFQVSLNNYTAIVTLLGFFRVI
jgi:hypothetical protein